MDFETQAKDEYLQRLNAALHFIEEFSGEAIKLEDAAAAAHFSPFHFHRIFSAVIGESPVEYLRRIRLEKAARLLYVHPEYSVTRVALETGFSSSAVFARAFLGRFGISASDYRKRILPNKFQVPEEHPEKRISITNAELRFQPHGFVDFAETHLAYVRSMKGYGPVIGKAWNKLFSWAYPRGLLHEKTRMYGIPLDDPDVTPQDKCRYFVSILVEEAFVRKGVVECMTLPKGRYVAFPFQGKALHIPTLYQQVYGIWLPQSGYQPDDRPTMEEYLFHQARELSVSPEDTLCFTLLLPIRPL